MIFYHYIIFTSIAITIFCVFALFMSGLLISHSVDASSNRFIQILIQCHLSVDPAFLLCFMYDIFRHASSKQKRRLRIMSFHIFPDQLRISIRITIPAQMTAGIVCPNIHSHKAGAGSVPLIYFLFRNIQMRMQCRFKSVDRHATGAIRSISCLLHMAGLSAHICLQSG